MSMYNSPTKDWNTDPADTYSQEHEQNLKQNAEKSLHHQTLESNHVIDIKEEEEMQKDQEKVEEYEETSAKKMGYCDSWFLDDESNIDWKKITIYAGIFIIFIVFAVVIFKFFPQNKKEKDTYNHVNDPKDTSTTSSTSNDNHLNESKENNDLEASNIASTSGDNHLKASKENQKHRVWLFGDSIIDNSYWNGVGKNTTGECLKKLLGANFEIRDRSTEELSAQKFSKALQDDNGVKVGNDYIKNREQLGIPYVFKLNETEKVDPKPDMKGDDFIFISVGGNDFALEGNTNTTLILKDVENILKFYTDKRGVKVSHIFYITPYAPTTEYIQYIKKQRDQKNSVPVDLLALYEQYINESKELCNKVGCNCISLENFNGVTSENGKIPEPTPEGAKELAEIIAKAVKDQIEKE